MTVEHLTMSDMFYLNALPADEEPVPIVPMVPARGSAGNAKETEDGLGRRPGDRRAAEKATKTEMLLGRPNLVVCLCSSQPWKFGVRACTPIRKLGN